MDQELVTIINKVQCQLHIDFNGSSLPRSIVKFVYRHLGQHINHHINYDLFADVFNQEYFIKNFIKNLIFFDQMASRRYLSSSGIIDIGCGAAPASIAYYKTAEIKLQLTSTPSISLIDKSYRQLELARRFCKKTGVEITEWRKKNFRLCSLPLNGMAHFSYFICEQDRSFIKNLYSMRKEFKNGFSAIDYEYNIKRLKAEFERNGDYGIQIISVRETLPSCVLGDMGGRNIAVYGCYYTGE